MYCIAEQKKTLAICYEFVPKLYQPIACIIWQKVFVFVFCQKQFSLLFAKNLFVSYELVALPSKTVFLLLIFSLCTVARHRRSVHYVRPVMYLTIRGMSAKCAR